MVKKEKAGSGSGTVAADSTPAALESKANILELRKRIAVDAEKIVHEYMPAKVLELTRILEEDDLFKYPTDNDTLKVGCEENVSKKRKLDTMDSPKSPRAEDKAAAVDSTIVKSNVVCPCNEVILKQQKVLKGEIQSCLQMLTKVKIWIQLNIPKVEDGNNFGVSIQEETVSELAKAEDTSYALLDGINKYFMTRGKLVSRVAKYPGVEDYAASVKELDRKERVNLCLSLYDLRNNYFTIFDSITKNLDKLKTPRSATSLPFT
mmetsp:Transcript_16922/g.33904  ORF Transcript_16922/g.33904 Transcript_16922/m.33904 type:complete len:263 (+) Transcript_16922:214-1002(+)|eukprot:CAMPEP_0181321432 /NCGR_PEP_ID=MMETSP1101-20121128/18679_1 /TAXON_ID=46948 /ORGANISM="Rhodomonas abbreviata, Strain Caron Lab Isolate" /LENGTH=262 /DNA_ID=CAMNT_0023429253 /DNA_START=197 /DNA_END=985 /DNA_ORIENTATION=+